MRIRSFLFEEGEERRGGRGAGDVFLTFFSVA